MRKTLFLIVACFASFITGLKAQELSREYLDAAKVFFKNPEFIEWIQKGHGKGRNIHPAIALHPISKPDPTLEQYENFQKIFARKNHTVIYNRPGTDSIVLTEQEKQSIMKSLTSEKAVRFSWTNEYFEGATFPVQSPDSLFTGSMKQQNGLYAFSVPVFLRNNTICIFNYTWIINGGGSAGYVIYIKTTMGEWHEYGEFGGGDY